MYSTLCNHSNAHALMAIPSSSQANGLMSLCLGLKKLGGSQSLRHPEVHCHRLIRNIDLSLSSPYRKAQTTHQQHGFGSRKKKILGKEVNVKIGGSFVFPPPSVDMKRIKRVIFIAGGVGINPIMSMLSYAHENYSNLEVRVVYSTKVPSRETNPTEVLFLPEMLELFRIPRSETTKRPSRAFFLRAQSMGPDMGTQNATPISPLMALTLPKIDSDTEVPVLAWTHRIDETALSSAVGNQTMAQHSVFYVCGPPDMTDELVDHLKQQPNVMENRVLCEKWW